MTSSVPTVEDFIESFPSTPPKIIGILTYETLTELRNAIKQNAASIPSNRGGGNHGYLGITVTPTLYATIAPGHPFNPPACPGAQPVIPANSTAAQIAQIVRQHNEDLREWREHTNVHAALKNQLTSTIEPTHLRSQRDRNVGFANVTLQALFTYLFNACGKITPQQLSQNDADIRKPWDPNTPFEIVINQIEDAMELADAGDQAYTNQQVLNIAYNLVHNTGLYFDECKEWNKKADADKTWTNFKTFFINAQTELRHQQQATSARQGHASFAADQENALAEGLANLATATAKDREAFANLVTNNAELAKGLKEALAEIQSLKAMIQNNPTKPTATPIVNKTPFVENQNYCWTHGHRVHQNHDSSNCKNPAEGHQREATRKNTMGGSTKGKPKDE